MSLIVRTCHNDGIIINKPEKNDRGDESYRGAYVYEPEIAVHFNVVSFDFTSLYPSVLRVFNLCASTLMDLNDSSVPDDQCLILEWPDHVKCDHDETWAKLAIINKELTDLKKQAKKDPDLHHVYLAKLQEKSDLGLDHYKPSKKFCANRKYKWLPANILPGIYPKIVAYLLDERVKVRTTLKLKTIEKSKMEGNTMEIDSLISSLNALQLALKLVANSLYGFTGSPTSQIPCVPIAMCITYCGRKVIQEASNIIKTKFNGHTIYGDTDSNYVKFEHITDYQTLYDYAKMVAQEVSNHFPDYLNIAFEDTVYREWLVINKKQYCYTVMKPDGTVQPKIGAKGLLLVRRDNCTWVRKVYEQVIRMIFSKKSLEEIKNYLFEPMYAIDDKNSRCQ